MRLLIALLALFWSAAVLAQDEPVSDRDKAISATSRALAALSNDLRDGGVDQPKIFEREVRSLMDDARREIRPIEDDLKRAEDALSLLGPAPKEGEPPESAAIAAERSAANANISRLRGERTRALAITEEGAALLGELSERRLRDYYSRVLERGEAIVAPKHWKNAATDAGVIVRNISDQIAKRFASGPIVSEVLPALGVLGAIVAAFLLYAWARQLVGRLLVANIESLTPTPRRRIALAGVEMTARLLPGLAGGALVVETARLLGLVDAAAAVLAFWIWLIAYLIISGFFGSLHKPVVTAWTLEPEPRARIGRFGRLVIALSILVGAREFLEAVALATGASGAIAAVAMAVCAIAAGGLLFAASENDLWPPQESAEGEAQKASHWGAALRVGGRIFAIMMIAAALSGHINLADFMATRLLFVTVLVVVALFLRDLVKEIIAAADRRLRASRGKRPVEESDAFTFWLGAGVDAAVLLIMTPALLLLAGADPSAVRDFMVRAFAGFRIGGVYISLADIVFAVASFVGILALTRVTQGALQRGPLAHSRVDPGVQNSLTTLFGYVGLVVAAVVSLGIIGVNLSNLALIAGALSVGIGFGLQAVVSNFVSGLILLFERPIKAGDWVVTTSGEGIVRKISFRSTEIETFDGSAIIVPNSELVAATVTNWTHKSNIGRVKLLVGVDYSSNPEQVRDILIKCAQAHPLVTAYPEPFVVWKDFGASSLDFELRAFVSDILRGVQVTSDLRFAIFKAFADAGISFPFPQQDIHIRSMPGATPVAPAGVEPPAVPTEKKPPPAPPRAEPESVDVPDD